MNNKNKENQNYGKDVRNGNNEKPSYQKPKFSPPPQKPKK
jgi:hypothetical protein